ncbi:EcsC family protein [Thalassobacillus hwangdonensis]|uniref:EcsC family protein n=1 Tax=Thalassobacillus hwangdonensis TaxID=546108 RepID=A0ABW3L0J3_9BACI
MSKTKVTNDIKKWRKLQSEYQPNDFEMIYDEWMAKTFEELNPSLKHKFFNRLDNWLFHTHAFLQGSSFQNEARERILTVGRVFNDDIDHIMDMKELSIDQLTYIAQQQISRGRLYSFAQGGLTGTGGLLLSGIDFPMMVVLNLRAVQLTGLTFGHEMNHPYEMMISLRVFHAATLPKRLQYDAWNALVRDIKNQNHPYIYEGTDELTDETWLEQPMKHIFKSLFMQMFRKKLIQGLPLISMGVGAVFNYNLTRQVTDFALRFYQYRHLITNQEGEMNVRRDT